MISKFVRCVAIVSLVSGVAAAPPAGGTRAVDAVKSKARFCVAHIWVERVCGTIPIASGTVTLATGTLVPLTVTAMLDATGVATGDPDRDAALRSPDFFDVQRYPSWTFQSTKITPNGSDAFTMDGLLTIRGVAQPERLAVTVGGDAQHPIYRALVQLDRHAFGMPRTRLDPVIGSKVDVTIEAALQ
jgi:polyisoprenoid-binding protein YceI